MKKSALLFITCLLISNMARSQTTAMNFNKRDCNGTIHNLFADLDAGNAVILHFYMASCGSCPPPAQKMQAMANNIMKTYPGKIKAYAIPYNNSITCSYSSTWVSSNGLSLFTPLDSGATQVSYYGGFGMPTIVLLGGSDHKVLFSTLSFSTSDTTTMRNKILTLFGATGINDFQNFISKASVFPNPAAEKLQFELNLVQTSMLNIEVINILGEVVSTVFEGKADEGIFKKEIETETLRNGMYIIRLSIEGKTQSYKFTVSR